MNVSPALTTLSDVSKPNQRRTGVPDESHSSTLCTVVAGMLVYVIATLELIELDEARLKVIV